MKWKQPIPTNLQAIFGEDYRSMALYRHLIYKACNEDAVVTYKGKSAKVQRGQVLFGRHQFSKELCWNGSTTDNTLKKLEQTYKLVSNQRTTNYTVVTLNNYGELVSMSNQLGKQISNSLASNWQATGTSKSVKSVKNKEETYSSREFLKNIPHILSVEYSKKFGLSPEVVSKESDKAFNWLESKGKTYKNYKAFFNNWLSNVAERNKVEIPPGEYLNSDGTWTIIKIDKGKRIQKEITSEDYMAQNY